MKRKLLLLFVLLMTAATGAWAQTISFYLVVSGTSATLEYGSVPDGKPYYTGSGWSDADAAQNKDSGVTTITVGTSCQDFEGASLLYLFFQFTALTTVNGLENLNYKSSVTNMYGMFHTCGALTTLDLTSLNTASVTNMESMFHTCTNLTTLNISGWNTENVENMSGMFNECRKLKAIYVGDGWSTGDHVTSSDNMFYACSNLPNWDEEKIDKTKAHTGADGYLNKVKVTANLANGAYWGTFYSNVGNHLAPEGTQVFAVNLTDATITMTEIGDRIVKSGKGVVLKQATESADATTTIIMTLTGTEPTGNFSTNSLQGTMTSITNPGNAYVLSYKEGTGVGFYKLKTDGTIDANKAYLTYDGKAGTRAFFGLDDNNGTTGIEMPVVEGNDNADTVVYDLQGRRVLNPTKGLYIVNGKKVVIK